LTYDDKHLPDPPHVNKKDLKKFIKRIRYNVSPIKVRYYGVGEYGDNTFRPHYHIILFGLDGYMSDRTIKRCWKFCDPDIGVHIGELNKESAAYITGYISKKTLKEENRHPVNFGKRDEFVLSSRRPGIGVPAVEKIVEQIKKDDRIARQVFKTVRIGGKRVPLGRLLKEKMNNWQDITHQEKLLEFWTQQKIYEETRRDRKDLETYDKRSVI
jgi:hypothetical protein